MSARYITTPIYYVNGDPHIGHAHTSVMADILKRVEQMRGHTVFLTTGTDEHGQKNQQSAEASGLPIQQYLDEQSGRFRSLFDRLDVGYDKWVRTTSADHVAAVRAALTRLHEKNLFVKKEYTGLYCVGCEQFKKKSDLDELGRCPLHQEIPSETTESNYFLNVAEYQPWLIEQLHQREDWIQPEFYRDEVLGLLQEPLEDFCISRPKSRVSLGVELPFDSGYVTYVWFDALLNYVSNIGWPSEFKSDYWQNSTHLMAKDIIKTHCVYWPIWLKALDLPVPDRYRIHGFWVGPSGEKMAKSLGNVVDPCELLDQIGSDGLRYFLARSMRGGTDSPISRDLVIRTYNAELANNIGNLYSRVTKLIGKYCNGRIPGNPAQTSEDIQLRQWIITNAEHAIANIDLHTISQYTQTIVDIADRMNLQLDQVAPWKLAKNAENIPRLAGLLYILLDCLRILFELAYPVIPATSALALANLAESKVPTTGKPHQFLPDGLCHDGEVGANVTLFPRVKA